MKWVKVGLFILALCISGLVGYQLGADSTNEKWVEGAKIVVPNVIDFVIERYEEAPSIEMFYESNRGLIRTEGMLLFIVGMGIHIDSEEFFDNLEHMD